MALANSAAAKREGVSGQWGSLVSGGTGVGTYLGVGMDLGGGHRSGDLGGERSGDLGGGHRSGEPWWVGGGLGGGSLGGSLGGGLSGGLGGWGPWWWEPAGAGRSAGSRVSKREGVSQWSVGVIAMRCGIYQRQRTWVLDVKTHL